MPELHFACSGLHELSGLLGSNQQTLRGRTRSVRSVAFSPDGRRVVSGGGDLNKPGELKVRDASKSAPKPTVEQQQPKAWRSAATAAVLSPARGTTRSSGTWRRANAWSHKHMPLCELHVS